MDGVTALHHLAQAGTRAGLGAPKREGLGIPGPFGQIATQMLPAGLYEVSGTQVALHDPTVDPSTLTPNVGVIGYFNNAYGDNGGKIVGEPDSVISTGQTADAHGYTWVQVAVDGGALDGKAGYVALKYLAPRGWTASHNGTTATPPVVVAKGNADEGDANKPPLLMTGAMPASWTPWLIGGLVALGAGGVLYALFGTKGGKKVRRRAKAHARLARIRHRARGRRRAHA
jgi:hypothetical protein